MLYYNRTDLSYRIDVAISNNSKKCTICHYWFFNHGFKFQEFVCNGCHVLSWINGTLKKMMEKIPMMILYMIYIIYGIIYDIYDIIYDMWYMIKYMIYIIYDTYDITLKNAVTLSKRVI